MMATAFMPPSTLPSVQEAPQDSASIMARAASLSRLLQAYAHRRRTVLQWMHPTHFGASALLSSVAAAGAMKGDAANGERGTHDPRGCEWTTDVDAMRGIDGIASDDPRYALLAEAFLDASALPVASLGNLSGLEANLARLSIVDALAVCRLRVLLDHAAHFRSWIDKPRRRLLTQWVGASMAHMLLTQPRRWQALIEQSNDVALASALASTSASASASTSSSSSSASSSASVPAPSHAASMTSTLPLIVSPLSETTDVLAWCGFRLLERDCRWHPSSPVALLRLALPSATSLSSYSFPWTQPLGAVEGHASRLSLLLLSQLPDFFPEPSW